MINQPVAIVEHVEDQVAGGYIYWARRLARRTDGLR